MAAWLESSTNSFYQLALGALLLLPAACMHARTVCPCHAACRENADRSKKLQLASRAALAAMDGSQQQKQNGRPAGHKSPFKWKGRRSLWTRTILVQFVRRRPWHGKRVVVAVACSKESSHHAGHCSGKRAAWQEPIETSSCCCCCSNRRNVVAVARTLRAHPDHHSALAGCCCSTAACKVINE